MLDLDKVIVQFETQGSIQECVPLGKGHIHDTYCVRTSGRDNPDYLLQRVNNKVFAHVPEMMDNIERITHHIRQKLKNIPGSKIHREVMTVIPTSRGNNYYIDAEDQFWRMFLFINDSYSIDKAENEHQANEAGKALGKFQRLLADFPQQVLFETIPDFHHIKKRLRKFNKVINLDPLGRAEALSEEIRFIIRRREEMSLIYNLGRAGFIPQRVTHNDTKLNNLLFDEHGKALTWVDLDTVMPGYVHYDFGDAIRTLANTAMEDESDLGRVSFHFPYYKSFTLGYLEEVSGVLTPIELIHLAFSSKLMTFIMGLRFLTDFIEGDVYYKIEQPEHNLVRARNQFKLLQEMENAYEDMKQTVETSFS